MEPNYLDLDVLAEASGIDADVLETLEEDDLDEILEGVFGRTVRKITGRGEGLSPKSNSAKRHMANKLDKEADDKYHRSFQLRHPHGLMRYVAGALDTGYGGDSWRTKYADKIARHASKQRAKSSGMRATAADRTKTPKYTHEFGSNVTDKKQAHDNVQKFVSAHHAAKDKQNIPGYKSARDNSKSSEHAYWKKHDDGSTNFRHMFTVTPTNKGYHVRHSN